MKQIVKGVFRKMGLEIHRVAPAAPPGGVANRVPEVLRQCSLETLPLVSSEDYARQSSPLVKARVEVRAGEGLLTHYRSVRDALVNESSQQYFVAEETAGSHALVKDQDGPYLGRQRMLHTVYDRVVGPDRNQCSLLDIGCSSGYYTIHADRLGFRQSVGIDARPEHADQFRLFHRVFGASPRCEFRHTDIEFGLESLKESFDVVLSMGVMYHVYDHPRFIRNMFNLTKRVLVLEGACSGRADMLCKAEMEETHSLRASIHGPVLYPSLPWMVELLRWVGFKRVRYVPFPEGIYGADHYARLWRAMLVAEK